MIMNKDFLNYVLSKYAQTSATISITDTNTRILASTDASKIDKNSSTAQYIVQVMKPSIIASITEDDDSLPNQIIYGTPIFYDNELFGTIITQAPESIAIHQGNIIKASLETAFEFEKHKKDSIELTDDKGVLAKLLLSEKINTEKISLMMAKQELDINLLRTVICIKLDFHQTSYFNINLDLGYQSSIVQVLNDAVNAISKNKYLNAQDIIHPLDRDTIVIIKTFVPSKDYSKIYMSLDKICKEVVEGLTSFISFSFSMAYGNLYYGITELYHSYKEATEIIRIGQNAKEGEYFYILENILFDNVCNFIHPQITNKILLPTLNKLTKKDGSIMTDLIDCAEVFVDNCMNYSIASELTHLHRNTISSRLDKLQALTGLVPAKNFHDAFITKMLAVYIRQNSLNKNS